MRFYRSSSDPSIRGVVDAFGVVAVAQSTLERHGGRVLKPSEVVAVPGTTVRPTVYRWAFLLVPDDILQDRAHLRGHGEELDEVYGGDHHRECGAVHRLNDALVTAGMELEPPPPLDGDDALGPYLPYLRRLPRAARLRVRRGGPPAVVDAWVALQTLRTAADADDSGVLPGIVDRIAMDHLLVGSAVTGGIVAAGPPTEGSPETGDGAPSAVIRPEYGRLPVDVLMSMPPRRSLAELGGQRRAVVAVLDTGVDTNRYLGVTDGPPSDWGTEPFVTVDPVIQEQVRQSTQRDHDNGVPTEVIPDFRERPVSGGLLLDDLNSHIGHGTFIAGVVRQVSPDVELRAIRIMLGDGIAPENALVTALELLNARLDRAADAAAAHQPVDPDDIVDVVSLSLGCFLETEQDAQIVAPLLAAVRGLAARGVIVVAAAGNFSTTRPFFPAFLAADPPGPDHVTVASVGALNPNGTKAGFSDDGDWVHWWGSGVAVVSTMPENLRGDRSPVLRDLGAGRETFDLDDYSDGVGIWSGTSFATPLGAATFARQLMEQSTTHPDLSLDDPSPDARRRRAGFAMAVVGGEVCDGPESTPEPEPAVVAARA